MFIIEAALPVIGPISKFFAVILEYFDKFTGNFGLSVVLLTIAYKVVVLPLSIKQTKSMIAMQKLQPQLKEIQKKYKDDREKQGQEMMKLYKENKVNPLGGCLPLLIQLPILFALFDVLHNTKEYVTWAANMSFLGIQTIAAKGQTMWSGGNVWDPASKAEITIPGGEYWQVILLILLTVVTGYISAKMMTTDPKQSKLMALMPVVMGVFAWILPAGVTIYIIVTNALTIAQQYVQLRRGGFYEEKRQEWEAAGEPTAFFERLKFKFKEFPGNLLVALRLREPKKPQTKKKKKIPSGREKAVAGKSQGSPAKKKTSGVADKKPAAKKPGKKASSGQKKQTKNKPGEVDKSGKERKPTKKKSAVKDYPAKKKSTGGGKKK